MNGEGYFCSGLLLCLGKYHIFHLNPPENALQSAETQREGGTRAKRRRRTMERSEGEEEEGERRGGERGRERERGRGRGGEERGKQINPGELPKDDFTLRLLTGTEKDQSDALPKPPGIRLDKMCVCARMCMWKGGVSGCVCVGECLHSSMKHNQLCCRPLIS